MAKCGKCGTDYKDDTTFCDKCNEKLDGGNSKSKLDYAAVARRALVGYWPMWVAGVLFLVMQWGFPLADWRTSWDKSYSYYSHGPLVPLISLFMVWANRKRIAAAQPVKSRWAVVTLPVSILACGIGWLLESTALLLIGAAGVVFSGLVVAIDNINPVALGLVILCASVPMFVFGRWTGSGIVCSITFFGFAIGALLLMLGRVRTKLLLFPILYLGFMIPAPSTLLDNATFRVQYSSTTVAAKMLQATGYDVAQVGSEIRGSALPDTLRVGVACSGFRMLISLLTFTAFFVYMLRAEWWKKALLVAIAFPLSVFVNALRIASIGWIGIWTGSTKNMMSFHDTWAMAFELIVSFAILFGFARLIKANDFGLPEPSEQVTTEASKLEVHTVRGWSSAAVMGVFLLVILTNSLIHPLEATAKGYINENDFSRSFGNWVSQTVELDAETVKELKTAAMVRRLYRYTVDDLPDVQVLVQAAADTDAFHDPHSCIPGGGSSIIDEKRTKIRLGGPRPRTVNANMLRSVSETGAEFVLIYWYDTESETYATTSQIRWKMRVAQIRDIKSLLLRRTTNEALRRRNEKRQTYCYRFSALMGEDSERDHAALLSFIEQFAANSRRLSKNTETL